MLIEEIEALHIDLWNAKSAEVELPSSNDVEANAPDLHRSLAARLRFSRGRAGDQA